MRMLVDHVYEWNAVLNLQEGSWLFPTSLTVSLFGLLVSALSLKSLLIAMDKENYSPFYSLWLLGSGSTCINSWCTSRAGGAHVIESGGGSGERERRRRERRRGEGRE